MRLNLALIIGLLVEFFIVIAAACGYFFYYIKMPEYSLNQARNAMVEGNLHELEKYADISRLLKDGIGDLAVYVPADDQKLQSMVKSGQFASLVQSDVEEYIKSGKWGKSPGLEERSAQELLLQSGLTTMRYRGIQYVYKGVDPMVTPVGTTEPVEVEGSTIDHILDKVDFLVTKYEGFMGFMDDTKSGLDDLENGIPLNHSDDGFTGEVAEAGISVYDASMGDIVILRVKLMEKLDGSWKAVDVANYGEMLDRMVHSHKRDMKRYASRVNEILIDTDKELEEYRVEHPVTDKEWVLRTTEIMKRCNEKIDALDVPMLGGPLDELLKERKSLFFEMMDTYYDSNERKKPKNINLRIEDANKQWMENRKAIQAIVVQYKDIDI